MSSTADRVEQLVASVLDDDGGLELYDVELAGGTLRVLIDRPGGIDLEVLTDVSREISAALDRDDPLPGRYVLEVSSPGLERPLRRPPHFAAAVGQKVSIRTHSETDGSRRVAGTIAAAGDTDVTVDTDDGEERVVPYSDIERARTVFEWERGAKPGGRGQKRSGKAPAGATRRRAT